MDGLTYLKMNNTVKTLLFLNITSHVGLLLNRANPTSHLQSQNCYVMGNWRYKGLKIFNKIDRERGEKFEIFKYFEKDSNI